MEFLFLSINPETFCVSIKKFSKQLVFESGTMVHKTDICEQQRFISSLIRLIYLAGKVLFIKILKNDFFSMLTYYSLYGAALKRHNQNDML